MTNEKIQDLGSAIKSLARAVEGLERQGESLEAERARLIEYRKTYLIQTAERLLPGVNKIVLASIRSATPGFVTAEIEKAFSSQNKILGIFTRSDYSQTLALLQSRYASYLDETKYGELKAIDAEIERIGARLERLSAEMRELLALLKMLRQADEKKAALPPELRGQVDRLSSEISRHKSSSRTSAQYSSADEQQDDYSDLLIYLATDFPTSVRTLMLSSIENIQCSAGSARSNTDVIGGDSGGYTNTDTIGPSSNSFTNEGISPGVAVGATVGVAAAAVTGAAIATDDSLGNFS